MNEKSKFISIRDENGYTLISVLMIGFLILSLMLGLVSIRYFNNIFAERRIQKKKLELACYSAVQKHLYSLNGHSNDGIYSTTIDSINVIVQHGFKGLFYEVSATARTKRDSAFVRYLFASEVNPLFSNALILSRSDIDAYYAGDNIIKGDVLAAKNRISKGDIFGLRTSKVNFLEGKLRISHSLKEKLFPKSMISKLFEYKNKSVAKTTENDYRISFTQLDTIKSLNISGNLVLGGVSVNNKSNNNCTRIYASGKITIEKNSESDIDLELISDSTVTIKSDSKIANMLVKAKNGVRLEKRISLKNVQVFSKKFIRADNVIFRYPSVLCILTTSKGNTDSCFIEFKGSVLNGTALLITDITGQWGNKSKIFIDEKSVVQGVIYSENNAEILGKVKGAVYTYNLYYYHAPTEYINWLVNLNIDRTELNKSFLLPIGLGDKRKLKVLREEWLY